MGFSPLPTGSSLVWVICWMFALGAAPPLGTPGCVTGGLVPFYASLPAENNSKWEEGGMWSSWAKPCPGVTQESLVQPRVHLAKGAV